MVRGGRRGWRDRGVVDRVMVDALRLSTLRLRRVAWSMGELGRDGGCAALIHPTDRRSGGSPCRSRRVDKRSASTTLRPRRRQPPPRLAEVAGRWPFSGAPCQPPEERLRAGRGPLRRVMRRLLVGVVDALRLSTLRLRRVAWSMGELGRGGGCAALIHPTATVRAGCLVDG